MNRNVTTTSIRVKSIASRALSMFAAAFALVAVLTSTSNAQLSKPVVVLKGTVRAEESGLPLSVKVSVRVVGDTAQELTASRSNSETGNYLVVLKPGKKYWIHLESEQILAKDTLFETPISDRPQQIVHDFVVTPREVNFDASTSAAAAAAARKPEGAEVKKGE